jgi:hypothetical protein
MSGKYIVDNILMFYKDILMFRKYLIALVINSIPIKNIGVSCKQNLFVISASR